MRKTGSRQSRRWIRTRRARDHMQARAKLIQRAPRGSPQHLTLTRWPGGLLFHDLGSPKGVNRRFQADSNTYEYLVALFDSNTNSGQRYSKRIRIVVLGGIRIRSEYE